MAIGIVDSLKILRWMGPQWVLWRAKYAFAKKSGLLKRRFTSRLSSELSLAELVKEGVPTEADEYQAFRNTHAGRFFFGPGELPDSSILKEVMGADGVQRTINIADDYCRGVFLYYSRHRFDLGCPVNWLQNPFTGSQHTAKTHWCDYSTFSTDLGDIKDVWEPSRFACAFWLTRAYALTREEKYSDTFWELFESWCDQNPVSLGPNWMCGQEAALRCMAWCFALYGLWNSPSTTPERICSMAAMLAVHAERIRGNIGYAISQNNNHSLSEATGLLTIGLLFPELKGANGWCTKGRQVLENDIRKQVYDDGSHVQHSMNYHRLVLHDCLWAFRLAMLNDQPFSGEFASRFNLATEFLRQMCDDVSGRTPNYGANDGALILPIDSCDYRDYRPVVQTTCRLSSGHRVFEEGPWDEALLWILGAASDNDQLRKRPLVGRAFDSGGYYTLRGRDSWCVVRCHTYKDRPTHVDMLHCDLWFKGCNVLGDSGSYRYFASEGRSMERYFKGIRSHNSIELDDSNPLRLVSRFLLLPWPRAKCIAQNATSWCGEHYGYRRRPWRVVHRREVKLVSPNDWECVDEILGKGPHQVTLRWHLGGQDVRLDERRRQVEYDLPCGNIELKVDVPEDFSVRIQRGVLDGDEVAGWESQYYGERVPRSTLVVSGCCMLPNKLVTRVTCRD